MKRLTAAALILFLFFQCVACVSKTPAPDEHSPENSEDPTAFVRGADFDNRFCGQQISLTETEDAYCWFVPMSHYIRYYDKRTGDEGVLCAKPECGHDLTEQNEECGGYVGDMAPGLSYYMGSLYFVSFDTEMKCCCLFRMAPDGSSRERLKKLEWGYDLNLRECCVHRGRLYVSAYRQKVIGAEPTNTLTILSTGLDADSEIITVWEEDTRSASTSCCMRFIGRYVYFAASYLKDGGQSRSDVYRLDTESGALDTVGGYDSGEWLLTNLWVDRDGTCWLSSSYAEPGARLVRIRDGSAEETITLCEENEEAHSVMMADGVLLRLVRSGNADIDELRIIDFEGEIVFAGKPPLAFFEEYKDAAGFTFTPGGVWGDKSAVFISYHPFLMNGQTQDIMQSSLHTRLVRYELTASGLVETQLGMDKWR